LEPHNGSNDGVESPESQARFEELLRIIQVRVNDRQDLKGFGSMVMLLMGVVGDDGRIIPERVLAVQQLIIEKMQGGTE
jgi:hypothetical protein